MFAELFFECFNHELVIAMDDIEFPLSVRWSDRPFEIKRSEIHYIRPPLHDHIRQFRWCWWGVCGSPSNFRQQQPPVGQHATALVRYGTVQLEFAETRLREAGFL